MRSVAGCVACRRQKVKCDEIRPICGRCSKAGRACKFGNIVFRHQQNSSLNHERNGLKKYYSRRRTFSASNTWLDIPDQVTFVSEDPAAGIDSTHAESPPQAIATQVTETGASEVFPSNDRWEPRETENQEGLDLDAMLSPSLNHSASSHDEAGVRACSVYASDQPQLTDPFSPGNKRPLNDIQFMLNPISTSLGPESMNGYSPSRTSEPGAPYAESPQSRIFRESQVALPVETDPKVAFLLRYFSEKPGKWLDLYFLDAYFELQVPIKALSHPLLKFACCAYAAKHLSRTRSKTDCPKVFARQSHVASTTTWPNHETVDWAWYAAKYYGQAITLLRETLQHSHDIDQSPSQNPSPVTPASGDQAASYTGISDETLAAMAILCNFEFMSASDAEWTRHLSGTMLVLDLRHTGVVSLPSCRPSKARKAIFWNYFRQDVFSAFILEGKTRLDIDDLEMWRTAGLELDDQGYVLPSNGSRDGAMKDDMISNAMIWLLSKVFNYIATVKEASQQRAQDWAIGTQVQEALKTGGDLTQELKGRWETINRELDVWYEGLPDSFQPCARVERSSTEPATESSPLRPVTIPDIWYTDAMCASTMQTYHLSRILLLVHRPPSNDTSSRSEAVFDFLNVYRSIEAELRFRSKEIFGIALSSPVTSIMLHQTQTIFVAAQCLVDGDERKMALDMLRRVNTDLGWESEYRVQQLLRHWGWPNS